MTDWPDDGDSTRNNRRGAAVVADGNMFVVGEERLFGTEELAHTGGVINGGVEVGVVGNMDGSGEGGAGDGV